MSDRLDRLLRLQMKHDGKVAELLARMDKVIAERNHLMHELTEANHNIFNYQKWFKKHEHLVDPMAVHNSLDVIDGNGV